MWKPFPDRLHLLEFTSRSQEDCRKNRTGGVLVVEVRAVILATILGYPDMTVLKASLQMSWYRLLGVGHQNSHGLEAKIKTAWFLEAADHFTSVYLIQRKGSLEKIIIIIIKKRRRLKPMASKQR